MDPDPHCGLDCPTVFSSALACAPRRLVPLLCVPSVRHHIDVPICSTGKVGSSHWCGLSCASPRHAKRRHRLPSFELCTLYCRLARQSPLTAKQHVTTDIEARNDAVAFLVYQAGSQSTIWGGAQAVESRKAVGSSHPPICYIIRDRTGLRGRPERSKKREKVMVYSR